MNSLDLWVLVSVAREIGAKLVQFVGARGEDVDAFLQQSGCRLADLNRDKCDLVYVDHVVPDFGVQAKFLWSHLKEGGIFACDGIGYDPKVNKYLAPLFGPKAELQECALQVGRKPIEGTDLYERSTIGFTTKEKVKKQKEARELVAAE